MNFLISSKVYSLKWKLKKLWSEEKGETNIVANIFIIIIAIGLAIIFRDRITALINNLFDKIDAESGTI